MSDTEHKPPGAGPASNDDTDDSDSSPDSDPDSGINSCQLRGPRISLHSSGGRWSNNIASNSSGAPNSSILARGFQITAKDPVTSHLRIHTLVVDPRFLGWEAMVVLEPTQAKVMAIQQTKVVLAPRSGVAGLA